MRHAAYRTLVKGAIAEQDLHAIRLQLQRQHALGPESFRASIEAQPGRRAGPAKLGRPRKERETRKSALSYPEIPGRIRNNDIINADVTAGPAEADKTLGHRACESDKSADPCFSFVDSER